VARSSTRASRLSARGSARLLSRREFVEPVSCRWIDGWAAAPQSLEKGPVMIDWGREIFLFVSSIVYATLGGALLLIAYWIFDKTTPLELSECIFHDKNVAAAIAVGAFLLSLAIIISAAIN
jgi:hypothetical protein